MKYYVYHLIDPRDDSVFYVGKGTGKRCFDHMKDALANKNNNICKENKIREIISAGLNVVVKKVFFTDNEQSAYGREQEDISEIGIDNLTNASHGKEDQNVRSIENAKFMLSNMRDYQEWIRVFPKECESWIISNYGSLKLFYSGFIQTIETNMNRVAKNANA